MTTPTHNTHTTYKTHNTHKTYKTHNTHNTHKTWVNTMNSMIGTFIAEMATLPICTVKTIYQTQPVGQFKNIVDTTTTIYKANGISGFYMASVPAVASQMFSTSSKYTMYKYICDHYHGNKYVNNTIGCVFISLGTHPLDCIKVNMQKSASATGLAQSLTQSLTQSLETGLETSLTNTPHIAGLLKKNLHVFREYVVPKIRVDGYRFLYGGYSKTLTKVMISAPLFFPLSETLTDATGSTVLGPMAAATIGTICMQPIDYLKTRQMCDRKLALWQGWNPAPYFRGLTLNLMRVVPHFTIVMGSIRILDAL